MRKTLSGLLAAGLVLTLAACGNDSRSDGVYANQGATVGITLPNQVQARWIADGKNMKQQFEAMGYKVNLQYADAKNQQEQKKQIQQQQQQVQSMVEQGNKLLVISAVDGSSLTKQLAGAAKKKIPVIAYDRLLTKTKDVGYQATFDNNRVGVLQGTLLLDRLGLSQNKSGPFTIELFAGDPGDVNAKSFYDGAMSVLQPYFDSNDLKIRSGQKDFKAVTTANYDGPTAGKRLKTLLDTYYQDEKLDAILSANDGIAQGMIKVLKANGYGPGTSKPLPFTSGQDAEAASVKSIIRNEQTGTIYKDTRELAKVAVQQGNALLTGSRPMINDRSSFNNGVKVVPTYLLYPVAVDKLNYQKLLVDGGYYKPSDLK